MEDGSELTGILNMRIAEAKEGHLGKIRLFQSPAVFGGIGPVSESDLERTTRQRQIGGIVESSLLRKIPDWESAATPRLIAAIMLDKFGEEDLLRWLENNSKVPITQDGRVVELKKAMAEALAKLNNDKKTA